jgi:hypothetical protein
MADYNQISETVKTEIREIIDSDKTSNQKTLGIMKLQNKYKNTEYPNIKQSITNANTFLRNPSIPWSWVEPIVEVAPLDNTPYVLEEADPACPIIENFNEKCIIPKTARGDHFIATTSTEGDPTYYDEKFPKNNEKYTLHLNGLLPGQTFCLDIRQAVKEISEGFNEYRQNTTIEDGGISFRYLSAEFLPQLIKKEKDCLHTSIIESKMDEKIEIIKGNASCRESRLDFFKSFGFLIKIFASLNPSQEIIKQNLKSPWDEIYANTFEYKRSLTRSAIGNKDKLCYNPFDKHERLTLYTPEEILEEDKAFKRIMASRFEGRDKHPIFEYSSEKKYGLLTPDEIREIIDYDINNFKGLCTLKVFEKFINNEMECNNIDKTTAIKNIQDIFSMLKTPEGYSSLKNFTDIFSGNCIRNIGKNLIAISTDLTYILGNIPELMFDDDSLRRITISDIPDSYRECFLGLDLEEDAVGIYYDGIVNELLSPYASLGGKKQFKNRKSRKSKKQSRKSKKQSRKSKKQSRKSKKRSRKSKKRTT